MKGPWKEYKAPNGKKYYYNIETKKTQWEKPVFESSKEHKKRNVNDRSASSEPQINGPIFVIPLCNEWKLVIWSNGNKFYLDPNGKSQKVIDDSDSLELLEYINKDKLILLIGLARGYNSSSMDTNIIYDELLEEIQQMKQHLSGEHSGSDNDNEDDDNVTPLAVNEPNPVSSHNISFVKEDDDHSDSNSQIISSIDKVKDSDNLESREKFIELLDRFKLDNFSTWRKERIKIETEPAFLLIDNDKDREQLFEDWCSGDQDGIKNNGDGVPDNFEDEMELDTSENDEEDDDELEPTKYHYLSHIINKANINKNTIFQDIKKEQKALFKEFKIKDFINSKKEQEQFVSRLLFYYKKINEGERKEAFKKLLQTYKTQISKSIQNSNCHDDLFEFLDRSKFQHSIDNNDSFEIETTLLKLEHFINYMGSLKKLMEEEPTYYIIGIKDKTIELFDFLYDLVREP